MSFLIQAIGKGVQINSLLVRSIPLILSQKLCSHTYSAMADSSTYCAAFVTVPNKEVAEKLAG